MRIDFPATAPDGLKRLYALQNYIDAHTELDPKLVKLLHLRASQLNGCAFCTHMHSIELREMGETDIRIDCVATWGETDLFSANERAALAWTEAITLIGETHAPDDIYGEALRHFGEKGLVDLTLAITIINTWNRLAIGFRADPRSAQAVIDQAKSARLAGAAR